MRKKGPLVGSLVRRSTVVVVVVVLIAFVAWHLLSFAQLMKNRNLNCSVVAVESRLLLLPPLKLRDNKETAFVYRKILLC